MATVKYGAIITDMKGKIGGTTFQGGPAGPVAKSTPETRSGSKLTKADAGRIVNQPSLIATLAGGWRNLTDEQRLTWRTGAPNFPFKNRYGDSYTASGYQVYMSLNSQLKAPGITFLEECPTPITVEPLPSIAFSMTAADDMDLTVGAAVPNGYRMGIWATRPFSFGNGPKASDYKLIRYQVNGDGTTNNLIDDWEHIYGSFPASGLIYFKVQMISLTTGQVGVPQYYYVNVVYTP